jgi:hypothetical protein
VARQLAEEGRTPEERAAYEADPAGAYATDASARASAANARMNALSESFDRERQMRGDRRAESKEKRQSRESAIKEVESYTGLKELSPLHHSKLVALAGQMYDNDQGRTSMAQIYQTMMSSLQKDESGMPELDENGNLIPISIETQGIDRPSPEISPLL